jgi:hypothetical protein
LIKIATQWPTTICLGEVANLNVESAKLIYKAKVKSNLGAELEFALGPEFERHVFNKPTCVICPEGFVHLPLITRWVNDLYAFTVGCLGDVHEAPWVNPEDLE